MKKRSKNDKNLSLGTMNMQDSEYSASTFFIYMTLGPQVSNTGPIGFLFFFFVCVCACVLIAVTQVSLHINSLNSLGWVTKDKLNFKSFLMPYLNHL